MVALVTGGLDWFLIGINNHEICGYEGRYCVVVLVLCLDWIDC